MLFEMWVLGASAKIQGLKSPDSCCHHGALCIFCGIYMYFSTMWTCLHQKSMAVLPIIYVTPMHLTCHSLWTLLALMPCSTRPQHCFGALILNRTRHNSFRGLCWLSSRTTVLHDHTVSKQCIHLNPILRWLWSFSWFVIFPGMRRDVNVLIFLDVRKALEGKFGKFFPLPESVLNFVHRHPSIYDIYIFYSCF